MDTENEIVVKQTYEEGEAELTGRVTNEDGSVETRTVETTKAVFEEVTEAENDSERSAHKAVFEKGEAPGPDVAENEARKAE